MLNAFQQHSIHDVQTIKQVERNMPVTGVDTQVFIPSDNFYGSGNLKYFE
jgi:hypothetical protein